MGIGLAAKDLLCSPATVNHMTSGIWIFHPLWSYRWFRIRWMNTRVKPRLEASSIYILSITSQKKLVKMKWDSIIRFVLLKCKIRSTKFEIRNNFKIPICKLFKQVLDFGHLEFEFFSSFDIRISDFDFIFGDAKTFARLCKEFLGHNTRGEGYSWISLQALHRNAMPRRSSRNSRGQ